MEFKIELTWSKLMALLVLGYAFAMDYGVEGHTALIYSLPFIVFLITGKQALDLRKTSIEEGQDKK